MATSRKKQYQRFERLKHLADQGDPKAQYQVGLCLQYGFYWSDVNAPEAVAYFTRAAEQNDMSARVALINKRKFGDYLDFLKEAHAQSIHIASRHLIIYYRYRIGDLGLAKQYLNESMNQLLQQVELDDLCGATAQLMLAYYYERFFDLMDIDREVAFKKVFTFSLLASNTGCAIAHLNVSNCYGSPLNKIGVHLSQTELLKRESWYLKLAAKQLEPDACILIWHHDDDLKLGLKYLQTLSDRQCAEASFLLAEFYEGITNGQHKDASVKQRNFRKAVKYYLKAASQLSTHASKNLRRIEQDILNKRKSKNNIMDFIIAHHALGVPLSSVLSHNSTVSKIKEEMEQRGEELKKEVNQIILHQYKLDVPKDILDCLCQYAQVLKSNDGKVGLLPFKAKKYLNRRK